MKLIRIGIIGVGGYARIHLESIAACQEQGMCRLEAAVIRDPHKGNYGEIEARLSSQGVRIYRGYEEMYAGEQGKLDLIAIPSGIDQHEIQAVKALAAGFHVMCEKPAAGTVAEAIRMREAADRTGKILAIGYQQIFSPAIQRIKALTLKQELGRLLKAKTFALWPRDSLYYKRNDWAGKMQVNGRWIYDCPIQNATAHFLNNMLYVAGPSQEAAAGIAGVYGENYRAKQIEAADTQYLRVECTDGVAIHHYASHAVGQKINPIIRFFYEKGKVEWQLEDNGLSQVFEKTGEDSYRMVGEFNNGELSARDWVFKNTIESIRANKQPFCSIHNSIQQLLCVEKSFESSAGIITVPEEYLAHLPPDADPQKPQLELAGESNTVIRGLEETVAGMYAKETGFAGAGLPWAKESKIIRFAAGEAEG